MNKINLHIDSIEVEREPVGNGDGMTVMYGKFEAKLKYSLRMHDKKKIHTVIPFLAVGHAVEDVDAIMDSFQNALNGQSHELQAEIYDRGFTCPELNKCKDETEITFDASFNNEDFQQFVRQIFVDANWDIQQPIENK